LTELLTQYGPITEFWFDGSIVIRIDDILDQYAPGMVCFQGPRAGIRWPGTEKGILPYPAWNAVGRRDALSGKATAIHGRTDGESWLPMECDTPIRDHYWMWEAGGEKYLKSVETLVNTYYRSVGHGGVLLLNSTPDTRGLIPEPDAQRAAEFGAEIRRRFGKSLAETSGTGAIIELDLGNLENVDHVLLMENIAEGERIYDYRVEGFDATGWRELCRGSSIGHKKIDFFKTAQVRKLRFRCLNSCNTPLIRRFAAFHVGTIPAFDRNEAVSIENPLLVAHVNVEAGRQTIEVALSDVCRAPRRYEVEICPENTEAYFAVHKTLLLRNGQEMPGAVIPMSSDRVLDLRTSWQNEPTILKMDLESSTSMNVNVLVR
jgi:alpha-L-fucosidase